MKKILSLFVAALASFNLMAVDYEWVTIPGLNFNSDDNAVKVHSAANLSYEQKQMASDDASNKLWGIKIGSSANSNIDTAFVEIDCDGLMTGLELGVSSCSTSRVVYSLLFSSSSKFDKESVIAAVLDTSIYRSMTSDNHRTIAVPAGAQSVRIYRKVKYNNVDCGAGSTVDIYYLKVSVGALATDVATLKDIKVNGESVEGFAAATESYNVELPYGTTEVPTVTATATQSNETVNVTPATALPGATTILVTAADGTTQKTYTVNFTVSTVQSNDASLKSLKVDGAGVAGFKADSLTYNVQVPYSQDALPVVSAEVNEEHASLVITQATEIPGVATVVVTAQDNSTQTYTINFTRATALKEVKEVVMSNGYYAWQAAGNDTIHAYYLQDEAEPTVVSAVVSDGASWTVESGKFKVTGVDASFIEYPFVVEAVAPVAFTADTITFDGTESWIKSGYGFDASKKWKFSKTDTDYSREWNGKTHIEMFLPACASISLKESCNTTRDIELYVNGVKFGEKVKQVKSGWNTFEVNQIAPFMLTIKSAQTSGDGGVGAIVMTSATVTSLNEADAAQKAVKVIENGKLIIIRNGIKFNAAGQVIK